MIMSSITYQVRDIQIKVQISSHQQNTFQRNGSRIGILHACCSGLEYTIVLLVLLKSMVHTLKFKKRLLLRCIHHFKSDLINNMDHMRISGTEPSSVILSQTM